MPMRERLAMFKTREQQKINLAYKSVCAKDCCNVQGLPAAAWRLVVYHILRHLMEIHALGRVSLSEMFDIWGLNYAFISRPTSSITQCVCTSLYSKMTLDLMVPLYKFLLCPAQLVPALFFVLFFSAVLEWICSTGRDLDAVPPHHTHHQPTSSKFFSLTHSIPP